MWCQSGFLAKVALVHLCLPSTVYSVTCPVFCSSLNTGQRAPVLGWNRASPPSSSTGLLVDCETILWNARMCQEGCRSESYRLFYANNVLIQKKKILCLPSLITNTCRLGIKICESPPLLALSVRGNEVQGDIILPVIHKMLSIKWNT